MRCDKVHRPIRDSDVNSIMISPCFCVIFGYDSVDHSSVVFIYSAILTAIVIFAIKCCPIFR
jgi:hypothetical protein